jgi:hypothetical protein
MSYQYASSSSALPRVIVLILGNGWPNREIEALMPWNYRP